MSLLKQFDALMRHLNSEDNGLAEEFRKNLEETMNDHDEDLAFLNCLRNAGVDNWDGYEFAIEEWQANGYGDEDK